MYLVFQIANIVADQTATESATMSPWELACAGGRIMIVLLPLLLVTIYVFVAKHIELRKIDRLDNSLIARIENYLQMRRKDSMIALYKERNTPEAHITKKGLKRPGQPTPEVLPVIENIGSCEVRCLERGLPLLATIAAGAPMIGFPGTVTGMVQALFDPVNTPGGIDVSLLLNGIYQALVTTVGGLIIGIATLSLYNCLVGRISRIVNRLEANTLDFMNVINKL